MQNSETRTWDFRDAVGDDVHFIYSTWLKSYRYFGLARGCKNSIFFPNYNRVVDFILIGPSTKVIVACVPESPSTIVGYIVAEPDILHYVFVKESFRCLGVGKSLFAHVFSHLTPEEPITVTHQTKDAEPIMRRHETKLIYNPFVLFYQSNEGDAQWQDQLNSKAQ